MLAFAGIARGQARDLKTKANEIEGINQEIRQIDGRLLVVEKEYATRAEPSEHEELRRRCSDAEIQFLLNNFSSASIVFYDLAGNPTFREMNEYPDALYMLAESLYQQQNYLSARLYFREHLNRRGNHYREALERYLEISGRINEYAGIDQYIDQARAMGGEFSSELAYVYGKWLFHRTDISDADRISRAAASFKPIADAGGSFAMPSLYFLGVIAVQQGDMKGAAQYFERALKLEPRSANEKTIRELTNLSLGRIYYELGKYDEAIDRYQEIDYQSDNFVDALYEIAWTYVRRGKESGLLEYEKANQACEKLLLAAPDSLLAPEASILQGHLLLKLGHYQDAEQAYSSIVTTYYQVYNDIDQRLQAHPQPVQYLQDLIAKSGQAFDVSAFLPPMAIKWATTQKEVAAALKISADLDVSTKGVAESNEIATRLLGVLEQHQLEVFPHYQEGITRSEAVDVSLARLDQQLLNIEESLLPAEKLVGLQHDLSQIRGDRANIEERFRTLPSNESDIQIRQRRMAQEIDQLDKEAFRLGLQVDSLFAMLAAVDKYVGDTYGQPSGDKDRQQEYAEHVKKERQELDDLRAQLVQVQKLMRDEKARGNMLGTGDADLRARYQQGLEREKELLASVRAGLPEDVQAVLFKIDQSRNSIDQLKNRSAVAKQQIHQAVRIKAGVIREKVLAESKLLHGYQDEIAKASGNAHNLAGSIAFESFKRVRKQFHDLVLKANVGLVDVAWTRKQDKTHQIQNYAMQKDRELKSLDEEFKEVLKDVE